METESYSQALSRVKNHADFRRGSKVIVEGSSGSGKSTLSMKLARDLGAARISTDCYLLPSTDGPYVDRLAMEFLEDDLEKLGAALPYVVFEGICARDTLARLNVGWNIAIYVKDIATNGLWHFEFHLEDFINGNAPEEDLIEPFISDYEYHQRMEPHKNAQFTYIRISD